MAVPSGDQRDWNFATAYDLPIPPVIQGSDISEGANDDKEGGERGGWSVHYFDEIKGRQSSAELSDEMSSVSCKEGSSVL